MKSSNIKRSNREIILVTLGLGIVLLLFNLYVPTLKNDDLGYIHRANTMGYWGATVDHYHSWSSRLVIEFFVMFFAKNFLLWQFINTIVMLGTIIIIYKFVFGSLEPKKLLLTAALYFLMPLMIMNEAGWIATTLNYSWPTLAALLAFYPFYQTIKKKKASPYILIFSTVLLVFAANQEQINLCFFVLTLIVSVYIKTTTKHYPIQLLPLSLISFAELFFSITTPGNLIRFNKEVIRWFPGYEHFSIVNKIDLGISSFGKPFFFDTNILFGALFALIAIAGYQNTKNYYLRLISLTPLSLNLLIFLGKTMKPSFLNTGSQQNMIWDSNGIDKLFSRTGTDLSLLHPGTWLATLTILSLLLFLCISLFTSFTNKHEAIFAIVLILMAFGSRLILGFSPTVWASGLRTYYLVFVVAIILVLMLWKQEIRKLNSSQIQLVTASTTVIGILTLIVTVLNN
ncbi:DUF6056 family protein [Lapidilactobacillus mulanensis]|uniref:DUF6056 family protein n=1 Tax=Lapidilactobacillus mulanensis TaxID=2485999 RepID=A0ABW4DRL1_9LACO|nr:DUF6056 family protein [Lapidilactobacillus mulanensis]